MLRSQSAGFLAYIHLGSRAISLLFELGILGFLIYISTAKNYTAGLYYAAVSVL